MPDVTIDKPGVEVIQQFAEETPTIITPSLPACVMGPCFQILEAVQDDGSLNSGARISLPARIAFPYVSTPFEYTGIGTDALQVLVNNAAPNTITFSTGPNLTVDEVADDINEAAIPGFTAVVEVSGTQKRVVIQTANRGENSTIEVGSSTAADVRTAFALTVGQVARGFEGYDNYLLLQPSYADYPDPRSNLNNLVIDYETVRAFLNDGAGNIREAMRTESFIDGATSAVSVFDDSDGDNLSPYLTFASAVFQDAAAVLTGNIDLSGTFGALDGTTLILARDGVTLPTVTFATPANAAAVISQINAQTGVTIATLGAGNLLVLTSATTGASSTVERTGGNATAGNLGLAVGAFAGGKPYRARAQGTVDLSGLTYPNPSGVVGRVLRMSLDGRVWQSLVFPAVANAAAIVTAINGRWGSGTAALNAANNLVLTSAASFGGKDSVIRIDKNVSDATLLTTLGLTTSGAPFETVSAVFGSAYSPLVGDEVWLNGVRVGEIVEIPVTPVNRLRISAEQLLTFSATSWKIIAKGLDNQAATATRPSSELIVDESSGAVTIKHGLFRESNGNVGQAGPLSTYLAYTALRQDVTPAAETFEMLSFGSLTSLEEALSPIDTQNPLGFGMYCAMLNAPGIEVNGIGVDEVSDTEANGTLDAYSRAFEFAESKTLYAIAPMTHDLNVGVLGQVHVDLMSEPANGAERCVILNPLHPTRKTDTLVASGPTANVSGAPTNTIATGVANLQSLLAANGLPGPTYTEDDAVFITFEDDTNNYLVESVTGGSVVINNGPLSASNDFFYDAASSDVFTAAIVDRPFTLQIRGAAITNRLDEARAYSDYPRRFKDRRVIVTAPDKAVSTVNGLDTLVEGFYLAAALAGKMSGSLPQQPFTEDSINGFKGVRGTTDRYSETGMKIMDGGGLWSFYAEPNSVIVKTRHQLTTDMSTIEKRENSITRALDFTSYMIRASFKNFVGRFNITTNLIDSLSLVTEGVKRFVEANKVLRSLEVVQIRQSEAEPDAMELIYDVGVYYPCNKIRVTLVIR